jgi:hypothetical protein
VGREVVRRSRLDSVTDWEARAERAAYCVSALAEDCGVTERHLRRYLRLRFGESPRDLLAEVRLAREGRRCLGKRRSSRRPLRKRVSIARRISLAGSHNDTESRRARSALLTWREAPNVRFGHEMSDSGKSISIDCGG